MKIIGVKNKLIIGNKSYATYIPVINPYITFSSDNSFTLATGSAKQSWDGILEYSTDKITWTTWNGVNTLSSNNNKLYLRGLNNTKITGTNDNTNKWVLAGTNISCEGNIENLLDYQKTSLGQHPSMGDYCFRSLFYGCEVLISAPELPALNLTLNCYQNMFYNCAALIDAPKLPATTLTQDCYSYMFYGCTSLVKPPKLPATTLAPFCYRSMFYGCSKLISAPELPATTLADSCYYNMFNRCTALAVAPKLPAITLTDSCYRSMFSNTGLIAAPELPATTLAPQCYRGMFNRSTLEIPPSVLPATTMAEQCYGFMFEFTKITIIPVIKANTYATDCFKGMFDDIPGLNIYSTFGEKHNYAWIAPSATYTTGMFGSDDSQTEWAKLDGTNFPNSGTPTEGTTYYFSKDNSVMLTNKGDIIQLNIDGENKQYRIIKNNGNTVEVMSMQNGSYGSIGLGYINSNCDTYLTKTLYNSLTETAKKAIVSKNIYIYEYSRKDDNSPNYSTKTLTGYDHVERKLYIMDLEDIEMYYSGTGDGAKNNKEGIFTNEDLLEFFWGKSKTSADISPILLRSRDTSDAPTFYSVQTDGKIGINAASNMERLSFQIDLTKIPYTIIEGN